MEEEIASRKEYGDFLKEKSVSDLVGMVMDLDEAKRYIGLPGEKIEKSLQERGYPIDNREDFYSFYAALEKRISELADSDTRVDSYLERAEQQRQLAKLPGLSSGFEKPKSLSKVEEKANLFFDELKAPFRELARYLRDTLPEGFEMGQNNFSLAKNLTGEIEFTYRVRPITQFKTSLCRKRRKQKDFIEIRLTWFLGEEYNFWYMAPEELIDHFKRVFLDDKRINGSATVSQQLKTFFSIPAIIPEYFEKRTGELEKSLGKMEGIFQE